MINNFCIGITSNWPPCTACHAGYGWEDETFDFTRVANIDCLVCHDTTRNLRQEERRLSRRWRRSGSRGPERGHARRAATAAAATSTAAAAMPSSMAISTPRSPSRMTSWTCTWASTTSCASTATAPSDHEIGGRSISVSMDDGQPDRLHRLPFDRRRTRMNASTSHTASVACQTCHIPEFARKGHQGRVGLVAGRAGHPARPARVPEDQGHVRLRRRCRARLCLVQRAAPSATSWATPSIRRR